MQTRELDALVDSGFFGFCNELSASGVVGITVEPAGLICIQRRWWVVRLIAATASTLMVRSGAYGRLVTQLEVLDVSSAYPLTRHRPDANLTPTYDAMFQWSFFGVRRTMELHFGVAAEIELNFFAVLGLALAVWLTVALLSNGRLSGYLVLHVVLSKYHATRKQTRFRPVSSVSFAVFTGTGEIVNFAEFSRTR